MIIWIVGKKEMTELVGRGILSPSLDQSQMCLGRIKINLLYPEPHKKYYLNHSYRQLMLLLKKKNMLHVYNNIVIQSTNWNNLQEKVLFHIHIIPSSPIALFPKDASLIGFLYFFAEFL